MDIRVWEAKNNKQGDKVHYYRLINRNQSSIVLSDLGARLCGCQVPGKNGLLTDVILDYKETSGYEQSTTYFGATIGRCCNRIHHGSFELNGIKYQLDCNNGEHHLHGGIEGFSHKIWKTKFLNNGIEFTLQSPHMDQHYPGKMLVTVTYTFTDDNEIVIAYRAVSDKDTICNLTNHSYFNLNGHNSNTDITNHQLQINADAFLPIDSGLIPTGEIRLVKETAFDFSKPKTIGCDLDRKDEQLYNANGYDHTFVLQKDAPYAAYAKGDQTGIALYVSTSMPGVQLYTGNFLSKNDAPGKENAIYGKHAGFALETQGYPDAVNHSNFTNVILRAGEVYQSKTSFRFAIES